MTTSTAEERAAAVEAYNAIVGAATLGDIKLVDLNFNVKTKYFDESKKAKASYDHEISEIHYDAESQTLGGMFSWRVTVEKGRSKALLVRAVYLVIYDNVPDVGAVHAEAYFRRVGRFATYPYFRTTVSQLSWASGAELPILPVLREPPRKSGTENEAQIDAARRVNALD